MQHQLATLTDATRFIATPPHAPQQHQQQERGTAAADPPPSSMRVQPATLYDEVVAAPSYAAWLGDAVRSGGPRLPLTALPFVDCLTRSSPLTPLLSVLPIVCWLASLHPRPAAPTPAGVAALAAGVAAWGLAEYALHRFVFHMDAWMPDPRAWRLLHMGLHGYHHKFPADMDRIFMPCVFVWPITAALAAALRPLAAASPLVAAAAIAFALSYMGYEYVHALCHVASERLGAWEPLLRMWRARHRGHHFGYHGQAAFGVSQPWTDALCCTRQPPRRAQ
jgi:sterol desaturase/sphingolipid hydroxylase (fatty acid hydroxylase superfamily)